MCVNIQKQPKNWLNIHATFIRHSSTQCIKPRLKMNFLHSLSKDETEDQKHTLCNMGCMTIKQNSSIQRRRSDQQLDFYSHKDFVFHIEPPSDCLSSISNLSTVLQKNPEVLFRRTDVQCCFAHSCGEVMPLKWTYTENGFHIFRVFASTQDMDLRRVKHNDL